MTGNITAHYHEIRDLKTTKIYTMQSHKYIETELQVNQPGKKKKDDFKSEKAGMLGRSQAVKCSLYNEDLNLDLQSPRKCQVWVVHTCNLSAEEEETEGLLGLAAQLVWSNP